jgi:cobalt-zinc-cadmium efflux system outer membrane protein
MFPVALCRRLWRRQPFPVTVLPRALAATCTLVFAFNCAPAAQAQTLTFGEALATAAREAPVLRAGSARVDSAQLATAPAGELPDPSLVLGLDNVPVEGDDRFSTGNDFMTMQRIGVMQEFTSPAKRRARTAQAQAQVELMRADTHEQRQVVLRETALAWIARHTWERQLAQVELWQSDNALFDRAVHAQLAAASGPALDALAPRQEAADIAALRDQVSAGRDQAIAQLRRWIGAAAELPLGGDVPAWPIDAGELTHTLHRHPELLRYASEQRVLDADIAQARADRQPDWDLTVAWLERGSGYDDMAMLEVRVDLPVFAGVRQNPMIASQVARRAALDAEREASVREHTAMLEMELSEHRRLLQAERRFTDVLLPLADEKVELAMAGWGSGEGALAEVMAARRARIATRLQAIVTTGELQQSAARLHYAYSDITEELATIGAGVQP